MERVVRRCKNPKCREFFGVIKLMKDKKAKCPFCGQLTKLNAKQHNRFLLYNL